MPSPDPQAPKTSPRRPGKLPSHLPVLPPRWEADRRQLFANVGRCFASNLGLVVFPSPPSSDIEVLSSCVRSCAIPTQVTSFPFSDRARCLGEWAAGVRSEPRAGMSSRCCCPPGAGCWGSGMGSLGKCSRQVCRKCGKLQKEKASSIILSVVSSVAPCQKEGMGYGRQVGREGSRYSFQVRPTRSPLAPSPKGYDEAQEIMALKTVFLYV